MTEVHPPRHRPRTRMMAHVRSLLRDDPRLRTVFAAGGRLEPGCDLSEIRVVARSAEGTVLGEARHEAPRWWLPDRSGRARAIAEDLASTLQATLVGAG